MKTEIAHEIPNDKPKTVIPQSGSFLMTHRSNYKGLATDKYFAVVVKTTSETHCVLIYICQSNMHMEYSFPRTSLEKEYVLLPEGYSLKLTQDNYGQ